MFIIYNLMQNNKINSFKVNFIIIYLLNIGISLIKNLNTKEKYL